MPDIRSLETDVKNAFDEHVGRFDIDKDRFSGLEVNRKFPN